MDRFDPVVLGMLLAYTGGCMLIFIAVVSIMRWIDLKMLLSNYTITFDLGNFNFYLRNAVVWLLMAAASGLAITWISNFAALLLLITLFLSCGNCGCIMVAIAQDMFPVNIR